MYKLIFFSVISICILSQGVGYSQEERDIDVNNPDATGVSLEPIDVIEELPIEDIIEGVGIVIISGVYFREEPNEKSKPLRQSTQNEKVIILGETDKWLRVRMFNNRDAYIFKKYIKTNRIHNEESRTVHFVNKKLFIEIDDLIDKFNSTLIQSDYAKKIYVIPYLKLLGARKVRDKLTITLLYAANNLNGKIVPSLKTNELQDQLQSFIELIFAKLMLTKVDILEFIIKVPEFTNSGIPYNNRTKKYATISLLINSIDLEEIKKDNKKMWEHISTTVSKEDLFGLYPR